MAHDLLWTNISVPELTHLTLPLRVSTNITRLFIKPAREREIAVRDMLGSFTVSRVNQTTFAISEDDSYDERPIIYAKLHNNLSLVILTDTGCASPSKRCKDGMSESIAL